MRQDLQPFTSADEAWDALLDQANEDDGESLDLLQHGLQTADGLMREGVDEDLVVAGLLHDLGDGRVSAAAHAPWAASLVLPLLGERVSWLIGAHADAKRYLCAVDSEYWDQLSPGSQRTLIEQGGVMTAAEANEFALHPWAEDAALLRRYDDAGKDPTYHVPQPKRFRRMLERVACRRAASPV